jgi:hypothetical protein
MSDLPLPGLMPKDCENLLSHEGRQRIAAALLDFDRIRKQARSAIDLRGDWGTPQAIIDMRQADLEATRTVLRAEAEEFGNLALPAVEFREIMRSRIESMVYSLEFSNLQRDALETEFLWPARRDSEKKPVSVGPTAGEKVRDFMEKKDLSNSAFAAMIRRSERIVGDVLADKRVGPKTQAAVAKALGTTREELYGD